MHAATDNATRTLVRKSSLRNLSPTSANAFCRKLDGRSTNTLCRRAGKYPYNINMYHCSYYAVIFLSPEGRRTPTMNCDIISISIIHTQRLETKRSRLELRRNVFSQRVVSHWNAFPEYVVKGSKLNQSARSRIDRIKNGAPSVRYELFARQSTATATARFLGNIPIRCE